MFHVIECLERLLRRHMIAERAIQTAAAVGATAKFIKRRLARRNHIGIKRHPHIIIGAEQDRLLALDHGLGGRRHLIHHNLEGITHAGIEQRLTLGDQRIEL